MTGIVTISIELELGWGSHDLKKYEHLSSDGRAEFDALSSLLTTCDNYHIPITFDVVGHLLHQECTGHHNGPYPDGWWDEDPGTDQNTDPLFYGQSFVNAIRDATIEHEICTHTYSHTLCEQMTPDVLDHELSIVNELHENFGLKPPQSIVTPRNQLPDVDVLTNHGIETLRVESSTHPKWKDYLGKFGTFGWQLLGHHPISDLEISDGLVKTPCTPVPSLTASTLPTGQLPPHPAFRIIPRYARKALHHRYLRSAIKRVEATGGHVHLWTHLYNMANQDQMSIVRSTLRYLAARRDEGSIEVRRMCDLPEVMSE